jgi:predicted ribosome quality control (RQC) complex YloA/Tae2 family protein
MVNAFFKKTRFMRQGKQMDKQTGNKIKDLQAQIDTLRDELSQVKEFMEQVRTEAQSVVFDECKIERVIVSHQGDYEDS